MKYIPWYEKGESVIVIAGAAGIEGLVISNEVSGKISDPPDFSDDWPWHVEFDSPVTTSLGPVVLHDWFGSDQIRPVRALVTPPTFFSIEEADAWLAANT